MIGHSDIAFVIDQAGHVRAGTELRPRPGNHSHQVLVRRRADRRRPAAPGAVMTGPAAVRPPPLAAGRRRLLAAGCGSAAAPRRAAGAQAPPPRAVPGHLPGHRRRHLGRRGDGRIGRQHNNFWQLFVRPAGSTRWQLVTPPGHRQQRRPGPGRRRGRSLVTGFRPSQDLTYSPLTSTSDGGSLVIA